jgi:hypothetical protein
MNPLASEALRIHSDGRGYARFYYGPVDLIAGAPEGRLDCTAADGSAQSQPIDLPQLLAQQPAIKATMPPPRGRMRPALTDPMSYSPAQLAAMGFPPRPSPDEPKFKTWLSQASKPSFIVEGKTVPSEKIRPSTGYSNTWAAVILNGVTPPSNVYLDVWGEWIFPTNMAISRTSSSVMYVGLDGGVYPYLGKVVQTGTETDNVPDGRGGHTGSYQIWWEWNQTSPAADVQGTFPGMDVYPGADMYFETWMGDASGTYDPTGSYAWYFAYNYDNAQSAYAATARPAGVTFSGGTAEFVVERPGDVNSPDALAHFSNAQMTGVGAFDSAYHYHYMTTDHYWVVQMKESADINTTLAGCWDSPSTASIQYQWYRPCVNTCP